MTMGLIVGNRGFFPDHLAKSGREEMLRALAAANIDVVALTPEQSKYGAVETRAESKRCAELFSQNRDRIDGVIVTLPNFGDERAIADTLRGAGLRVPVLVQATPDNPKKMTALQQSSTVRNSVLHHQPAHRESRFAGIRPGSRVVCGCLSSGEGLSKFARGGDRRKANRIQHGPL